MRITRRQLRRLIIESISERDQERYGLDWRGVPQDVADLERDFRMKHSQETEAASDEPDVSGNANVFSIRMLSPGPAYFMDDNQIPGDKAAAINTLITDENTGVTNFDLLARIAQGMGAELILDENFQETDRPELYVPMPVERYIALMSEEN